jgi:hypothetical protein
MIYSTELSERILDLIESVALANNGYAFTNDKEAAEALEKAGYIVKINTTGFAFTVYSLHAYECAKQDYKNAPKKQQQKISFNSYYPDYEGAILARQEKYMMDA